MRTMRVLVVSVLLAASVLFVTGCNTVRGVGKDIERGGEKIQRAVDR